MFQQSVAGIRKRVLPNYYFMLFPVMMTVLGLFIMLSLGFAENITTVTKQGIFCLIGILVMLGAAFFDHTKLLFAGKLLMVVSIILLVVIELAGITAGGATRWISIAGVSVQGSELTKFAVVFYLSALSATPFKNWTKYQMAETAVSLTMILLLVYKEPDLGTTIIISSIIFAWLIIMGVKLIYFIPVAAIFSAGILVLAFTKSAYQKSRILTFLDPYHDETGAGYQIIQGWISIGSGGVFGNGLGGNKNSIYYLPANHTDFIFSTFAETFGLLGCVLLLLFVLLFVYFGLYLANNLKHIYNQSLAFLITMLIGFQFILNICVNLGLVPTTGIPLPFISNGGSALLVFFALCGVLTRLSIIAKTEKQESGG